MKTQPHNYSLVDAQQEAIDAILALRAYPNSLSRTGRLPRSERPIYRKYVEYGAAAGFTSVQIHAQWRDIIDMVVLANNAQEE